VACISSRMVFSGSAFGLLPTRAADRSLVIRRSIDDPTALRAVRSGAASHLVVSFIYVLGRSVRAMQDREPRSRTFLNRGRPRPTYLESELGNPRENGPTAAPNGIGPERGNRARFAGRAPGKPAPRSWIVPVPG
jgi:hypothetical protein